MAVTAEIKDNSIFFYEDGKLTYASVIEYALMDLRWAGKHQPPEMTEKDYEGCLATPQPRLITRRKDNHVHSGYRMRGHSICEYCENHHNLEEDPAGACVEDVAIYAHFEDDASNGPIDSEDFLTGKIPVKELIKDKVVVNCPKYKFNSDFSAEATL